MGKVFFFVLLLCIGLSSCVQKKLQVESPDGQILLSLEINRDKQLSYSIEYGEKKAILESVLGFELKGGQVVGKDVKIHNIVFSTCDTVWTPVYGEQSTCRDNYNQAFVTLVNDRLKEELFLTIRVYNEGAAFRYTLPENGGISISKELTQFAIPEGTILWASYKAERPIMKMGLEDITDGCERPLLLELPNKIYIALGEASLVDFARMKFLPVTNGKHALVASLDGEVVSDTDLTSPWRYVMLAESPSQLLENNNLLLNLNDTNRIDDTSWIKPGKVLRDVTLTTQGGMACVDFAVDHGLQYIEFDAGWYGTFDADGVDASSVTIESDGSVQLDLLSVIEYGKMKGIGVILFVHQISLEKQLDELLPLYKSWGVAGLKFGYVETGSQKWTSWLHEAVRKCAEYKLMVGIHDVYRPTGYSRTYPNLMTQEGLRGDEQSPDNEMVINTIFTRSIAGASNQANCYFAERVGSTMGSHASQMAKAICIYSPWQLLYWYDRPEGSPYEEEGAGGSKQYIQDIPDLNFFRLLPTVWDESRVLEGYPGDYAVIARKSGHNWFVGALNGDRGRQITINLDFLDENKSYEATLYSDDPSKRTRTNVHIRTIVVDHYSVISQNVSPDNGLAVIITPKD